MHEKDFWPTFLLAAIFLVSVPCLISQDPNLAVTCVMLLVTVGQMPKKNILCHVTWNILVTQVTSGEPRRPSPRRRPIAVWGLNIRLVELLSAQFRLHVASYLVNVM